MQRVAERAGYQLASTSHDALQASTYEPGDVFLHPIPYEILQRPVFRSLYGTAYYSSTMRRDENLELESLVHVQYPNTHRLP